MMTAACALRVVPTTMPRGNVPNRSGAEVLDDVASFVARFNVFPSEYCVPTLALWYAHTHMADRFYVTPRLILDSAEPGSGKTRVLEVAQFLVSAPEMTISAKPAALFRLVQAGPITILFDEVDTIFNPKTSGNGDNDDLRAMLNAGYKRSATIPRCVGDVKAMQVKRFKVYAPAVLAGIAGGMPATITTRAITIHMRRRRPDERVDQFREKVVEREAQPIRDALITWVTAVANQVGDAEPEMPQGVTDRSAEIWEATGQTPRGMPADISCLMPDRRADHSACDCSLISTTSTPRTTPTASPLRTFSPRSSGLTKHPGPTYTESHWTRDDLLVNSVAMASSRSHSR